MKKKPNRREKRQRRRAERAEESARVWEAATQETERAKAYIEGLLRAERLAHRMTRAQLEGSRENVERLQRELERYRRFRIERNIQDGDVGLNLIISHHLLRHHKEEAIPLVVEDMTRALKDWRG